ncbi:MAG TPA: tetratricopeptide repeat protein [Actinoplanes sp.]|nr:tetratricopeptide repeat protein [Actinoplanes sp.]
MSWPVLVGVVPALASAFQPRGEVRARIRDARDRGADVVLTGQDTARPAVAAGVRVLAGGGGVGKSQLAAWFAHQACDERTADLVLWVNAAGPEQVITAYAQAAVAASVPGATGDDLVADAGALLRWLRTTDRPWLVVLDDVTDPGRLSGWWPPHRPGGWTIATTRLQDPALISAGRRQIDVGVYSPPEARRYLHDRLGDAGQPGLYDEAAADDLASELGYLPLALSHAAAYMIYKDEDCGRYLTRYQSVPLAEAMPAGHDPDDYGRPVAVTLLLAVDAADRTAPAGLARPALALTGSLDPAGHPGTLWGTTAVTDYLSRYGGTPVTVEEADEALRLLHRYGLITHRRADGVRAVRIHALTARAARETIISPVGSGPDDIDLEAVTRAAAGALLQIWPVHDHHSTELVDTLRTNAAALTRVAGAVLWHPGTRPLLYRAGTSLLRAGLHTLAVGYWEQMTTDAVRLLGSEDPSTLTARGSLASAYWQAGRTADATGLLEQVAAARARVLGAEHPSTLTAHANLGASYRKAGRTGDAIAIEEQVAADMARLLGAEHPNTLTAHANLAASYWQTGRTGDAINLLEQVVAERIRVLGAEHPDAVMAAELSRIWQAEA